MDASSAALSAALKQTRTVAGTAPALPNRPGEVGLVPEYALLRTPPRPGASVLPGTDWTALLRYGWLPSAAAVGSPGAGRRPGPAAGRAEEPGRGPGVRGGEAAPARRCRPAAAR